MAKKTKAKPAKKQQTEKRRLKVLAAIAIMLFVLTSISIGYMTCIDTEYKPMEPYDAEQQLVDWANKASEGWEPITGRTFDVQRDGNEATINVNGAKVTIDLEELHADTYKTTYENPVEFRNKTTEKARARVLDYIQNSSVLKEKDELSEFVRNLPIKTAEYENDYEVPAEFDFNEVQIVVNKAHKSIMPEWGIVHEFIHAIAWKTNGGIENERYSAALFNEVMTDLITANLNPDMAHGYMSAYSETYTPMLSFLSITEKAGIEAYYYGYSNLVDKIGENELDVFVYVLEGYNFNTNNMAVANNCLNKWMIESEKWAA